jgi:hypothetical protein
MRAAAFLLCWVLPLTLSAQKRSKIPIKVVMDHMYVECMDDDPAAPCSFYSEGFVPGLIPQGSLVTFWFYDGNGKAPYVGHRTQASKEFESSLELDLPSDLFRTRSDKFRAVADVEMNDIPYQGVITDLVCMGSHPIKADSSEFFHWMDVWTLDNHGFEKWLAKEMLADLGGSGSVVKDWFTDETPFPSGLMVGKSKSKVMASLTEQDFRDFWDDCALKVAYIPAESSKLRMDIAFEQYMLGNANEVNLLIQSECSRFAEEGINPKKIKASPEGLKRMTSSHYAWRVLMRKLCRMAGVHVKAGEKDAALRCFMVGSTYFDVWKDEEIRGMFQFELAKATLVFGNKDHALDLLLDARKRFQTAGAVVRELEVMPYLAGAYMSLEMCKKAIKTADEFLPTADRIDFYSEASYIVWAKAVLLQKAKAYDWMGKKQETENACWESLDQVVENPSAEVLRMEIACYDMLAKWETEFPETKEEYLQKSRELKEQATRMQ